MTLRPARSRESFATFVPQTESVETLERASFKDQAPIDAARRLVGFHDSRNKLRLVTQRQREKVLATMLTDFQARGLDLSNITREDVATYRAYLAAQIARGTIGQSYAAHIAQSWNATMRVCFAETGRPGEGLIMRGWQQYARHGKRLDEEGFNMLLGGAMRRRYRSPLDRESFITYLEVEWAAGARVKSIREAVFADVDYERMVLALRHMKNRPDGRPHEVVLTERAAARLHWMERFLETQPVWRGCDQTPLIPGTSGLPLTGAALNRMLKGAAALAGLDQEIWNHLLRKSVGTHIAKINPRLAADQLGITSKVLEAHYNMPTVEDRIERRDIIPGSNWRPTSPEELVGRAFLERARGASSKEELHVALDQAARMRALPGRVVPEVNPYG